MISDVKLKLLRNLLDKDTYIDDLYAISIPLATTLAVYKYIGDEVIDFSFNNHPLWFKRDSNELTPNSIILNRINHINISEQDDFVYEDVLSAFINSQASKEGYGEVSIYSNNKNRIVYIYRNCPPFDYCLGLSNLLPALITKLMPYYFENIKQEDYQRIANELIMDDTKIDEELEKLAEKHGLIEQMWDTEFNNVSVIISKKAIEDKEIALKQREDIVDQYTKELCHLYDDVRNLKTTINTLKMKGEGYQQCLNELRQLIKQSKGEVSIVSMNDVHMRVFIKTVLDAFDEEMFNYCIQDRNNYNNIYFQEFKNIHPKYLKRAYKKLFISKECKIHTSAVIDFDLMGGYISSSPVSAFDSNTNVALHPHLSATSFSACFGDAQSVILSYIKELRFAEALAQILYSAKQFTLEDSAAADVLLGSLKENKAIELPTGEFVNMKGLIDYLDKTEGEIEDEY